MSTTTAMAKMTVAKNKPSDRKCTVAESAPSFINERASAPRPKTSQNIAVSDCERNAHRACIQRQVVSFNEDSIEPVEFQRQQRIAFSGLGSRGLQLVEQLKSESLNPREGSSPPPAMILKTLSRQRLRPLIYLFLQTVFITVSTRTIL